jgi:response regulator of citrate/malate metabolism
MTGLLDRLKFNKKKVEEPQSPQPYSEVMIDSFSLGLIKDLRRRMEEVSFRLDNLEKTLEERLPAKVSVQPKIEDIVMKSDNDNSDFSTANELGVTESKKIETIKFVLKQHQMLSSMQLAQLLHMSRTRANEYFKKMEDMNLVESSLVGKEKYYKIKV